MSEVMKLSMVLSATDKMSRVIDQATKKSTASMTNFQKRANAICGKMQKIGSGMAASGAAITGALFADVDSIASKAKQIEFSAQKVGMSTQSFQKYSGFAEKMGVEITGLEMAFGRLSKAQISAAMGNKAAAKIFKMSGLSIYDSNGRLKNSSALLTELSDKFKNAPNGPKKTALAMMLFGKSGKDLIPMLNQGSKAIKAYGDKMEQYGVVLTDKQIAEFKKYRAAMGENKLAMMGIKTTIAVSVLPTVIKYMQKIADISKKISMWTQRHKTLAKTVLTMAASTGILLTVLGTFLLVSGTVIRTIGNFKKIMDLARIGIALTKNSMILFKIQYYALAVAQKVATAGQWLLNSALLANPITWVVVGIAALTAAIVIAWKKFAWFRAGIKTAWDTIKGFGNILKEYVIDRIKGLISGIGSIGKAFALLRQGKFSAAGKVAWSGVKDLSGITATQNAIKKSVVLVKSVPGTYNRHLAIEEAAQRAKDEPKSRAAVRSTQAYNSSNIQRANISNAPAIHYAPVIHLNGGSPTVKQDISKILNEHKTEIEQWLKKYSQNQNRLSFN